MKKLHKIILGSVLSLAALLAPMQSHAATVNCFTIASGTYTTTQNTAWVAIPRTARRIVFVTSVTAVSGTTPNLTANYQHSWSSGADASTTNITMVTRSSVTATGGYNDPWVTSGNPQTTLPYVRIAMTITGTTPSFTAAFLACYEEQY